MSSNSFKSPVETSGQGTGVRTTGFPFLHLRVFSRRLTIGGYSLAVISIVLAFLLRLLLDPWLGNQSPYLMFVIAVAATGLYAGVRPAVLATALGTVVAYFCFVAPRYHWGFAGISDAVLFGVYLLAAVAIILLTGARIRAAATAEQSLKSQIEAERKLLDAQTLFRHFMDHSSACAYLRGEEGRCVYANESAKREFGIEPEGGESGRREAVDGSTEFQEQDRQVLDAGEAMEFADRTSDGRYWLTNKFPFVDQSGRKFVGGISFEITDRIKAEEILRKTERLSAAGQMASLLAHEINNPLAALTNVMFLLSHEPLASPAREFVSQASDALLRINRIAGMTMGFFFEKDTPGPVRIGEIIEEVAETLTSADRFNGVRIMRDYKCDATVVASPPRIRQLIVSLLTNAMESDAKTVRVRIRLAADWRRQKHGGVRITIADDGCGIRAEVREKIFEPFFSSKSEKGTGLGLWASRAVVLRNDGAIRLRSAVTGPRKGTCVSVFLPIPTEIRVPDSAPRRVAGIGR